MAVQGNPNIGSIVPGMTPIRPGLPALNQTTVASIALAPSGAGADNFIVAAVAGKTVRVHRMLFTVSAAVNITVWDGPSASGNQLSGAIQFQGPGSSMTLDISGEPWYVTSSGNGFNLFTSAAVTVSGTVWYVQS